ncbi:hypothetical protein Tco_0580112 [Tanacetum coccineum]
MGDENPIRTLGYYFKPSHEGYRNTIELLEGNNVVPLRFDTIRLVQNGCSFHEFWSEDPNQHLKDFLKLVDSLDLDSENKERTRLQSWALLEDLALYDNESWNDPKDFAKPVKAIALPQDVSSTSNRRLIELENQVQHLIEVHIAPTQPTQVNKLTTLCKIYSGSHDTQYCMEDPEQTFVEYASSRTDEAGGINDSKRYYGFEPGLLGKSVSLGVDISNWEMFDDDWGLESKEVSPLGEELSLFDRPNEVERGRILEAQHLDPILQQQISQRMAPSHHDGNFSSKTKNEFSQSVEMALRFVRDTITTTPMMGLYLIRRSLEVLKKFHWMILGGRSNQLSHVSSLLMSKPGGY